MKTWNLGIHDPLQLTLAADSRFSRPDYSDDSIWELQMNTGEPNALALYTTYGLRARSMRLFPLFSRDNKPLTNPAAFHQPPQFTRLFPNYISATFSPYGDISFQAEYWAVSSDVVAGRLTLENPNRSPANIPFEWVGVLYPLVQAPGLHATTRNLQNLLEGSLPDINIVCLSTNGPEISTGPYPGLAYSIQIEAGGQYSIIWACATAPSSDSAYELARKVTGRNWDAEIARIERTHDSQVIEISSGRPDWDTAFMLSQRTAAAAFYSSSPDLPHASFVLARNPVHGFSILGNGKDFNSLWNGQTVLDTLYIAGLLFPGQAERVRGLVDNFLSVQQEDGFIDWKPGLAGQRSKRLAQPLLATIAWQVYTHLHNSEWIAKIYPRLLAFFNLWFSESHDRDQDGFPEWDHPYQPGLDPLPIFNPADPFAQGVDIPAVESPALAAMLFAEAQSLIQMAGLLDLPDNVTHLQEVSRTLHAAVESTWDAARSTYSYRDAAQHTREKSVPLVKFASSGTFPIRYQFESPQRLLLHISSELENTRNCHFIIQGTGLEGPIHEEISSRSLHWLHGNGVYTSQHHYLIVNEIIASNIQPGDTCQVGSIDFTAEDISLLLPLWARMVDPQKVKELITKTILQRYRHQYGLAVIPDHPDLEITQATRHVFLPWNQFVIEGLLNYGFRQEAANLLESNMNALTGVLIEKRAFQAEYDSQTGKGFGELNLLTGLAPLGTFLHCLGVVLLSEKLIILEGLNPFSWPVTVQYRWITLEFSPTQTILTTRFGKKIRIRDENRHEIQL